MAIEIAGRNYEINDRIRELIEGKLERIRKYFKDIIDIRCVLNVEKYRNICEISVIGADHTVLAMQEADSMEEAISSTIDHLKRQAQKNSARLNDRHRKRTSAPESWQVNVMERGSLRDEQNRPRIIKTNNLPIRPMSVEQAAMMLDGSRNEFIVFKDLDTEKVTVIYKRQDDNFGVIAPEF
jgi:putative sigma-54 modulation protein